MASYKENEFLDSILLRICGLYDGVHLAEALLVAQDGRRIDLRLDSGSLVSGSEVRIHQPRYKGRMSAPGKVGEVTVAGAASILLHAVPVMDQSRNAPRVDTRAPFAYRVLGPMDEAAAEKAYANEQLRCHRDRGYLLGTDANGVTVLGWRGQKVIAERKINLSCSGACLDTVEQLSPGCMLMLYLFMSGAPYAIPVLSQVLECAPGQGKSGGFQTRIRFVCISDRDEHFIDTYVTEYAFRHHY